MSQLDITQLLGIHLRQIFGGDVKPIPNSWVIYQPLLNDTTGTTWSFFSTAFPGRRAACAVWMPVAMCWLASAATWGSNGSGTQWAQLWMVRGSGSYD